MKQEIMNEIIANEKDINENPKKIVNIVEQILDFKKIAKR